MNARHILTLLKKEFLYGPKNFIFIMALVMPVVITLAISLLLGTLSRANRAWVSTIRAIPVAIQHREIRLSQR